MKKKLFFSVCLSLPLALFPLNARLRKKAARC